jgi:hypothetical protein
VPWGVPIRKIPLLDVEDDILRSAWLDVDALKPLEFKLRTFDHGTEILDIHLNDFIAGTLACILDSHSYLDLVVGLRAR